MPALLGSISPLLAPQHAQGPSALLGNMEPVAPHRHRHPASTAQQASTRMRQGNQPACFASQENIKPRSCNPVVMGLSASQAGMGKWVLQTAVLLGAPAAQQASTSQLGAKMCALGALLAGTLLLLVPPPATTALQASSRPWPTRNTAQHVLCKAAHQESL
jgi:hypothetical protein